MSRELPISLIRVLKISVILIFISAFTVIAFGIAANNTNEDIKKINKYLHNAQNIQSNFEQSLIMYTETTKDIIGFLLSVRPQNEDSYIKFISQIEEIADKLSLDIELKSEQEQVKKEKETLKEKSINYNLSFLGSFDNLSSFLAELDDLPYYIKITNMNFRDPRFIDMEEENVKNININLKLFIK